MGLFRARRGAREAVGGRDRWPGPLGPSSITPLVTEFWNSLGVGWVTPGFADRVGVVARCLQLNCQQIATMPLRHRGAGAAPPWVTNPDPVWYPNGICDAVFAATWSMYAWGDAFLWVTSRYADTGYPMSWTVLDPCTMQVDLDDRGHRAYRSNGVPLRPEDVLQVTRDPRGGIRGTSALSAYAANLTSALGAEGYAAGVFGGGGVPHSVLQPARRLTSDQAAELQAQWMERVGQRLGAPAVIPPDVQFTQLAFSPRDMLLLESREFDARQLAAAFGVPPFLVNLPLTGGLTYQSPAMLADLWWRTELMPAAHRLEAAMSTMWLARGSWVEFDPSIVLRPDPVALTGMWCTLLEHGAVTVDEVRAAVLDLPPLAEGPALDLIDEPAGGGTSPAVVPAPSPVVLEVVS